MRLRRGRGWRRCPAAGLVMLLALLLVGPAAASQAASPQPAAATVAAQPEPDPYPEPVLPPTEPPPESKTGAACAGGDNPAVWDVGGQVQSAITEFFCDFVEDTLNDVLSTLGESVLATPDLTGNEPIREVWTANLVIANTIFVLFIVAGGFVVASRETLQTQFGLKELIPRIVVAGVAANLSLLVVRQGIEFTNALSAGIAGEGVDTAAAAEALTTISQNATPGTNFLLSLLMIAIIVMAIIVLVTFIIRVAVLAVLITVAPVALLFHALPQTEQVAFVWWKAVAGCFAIQLGQAVVLVAAVRIFLTPTGLSVFGLPAGGSGWLGVLVALAMLWLLVKIPMWVRQFLWLQSRGVLRKVIVGLFMLKTLSLAVAGRGGRSGHGGPRPDSGGQTRPGPRGNPGPGPNPRNRPNPGTGRGSPGTRPGGGGRPGGREHRIVDPAPDWKPNQNAPEHRIVDPAPDWSSARSGPEHRVVDPSSGPTSATGGGRPGEPTGTGTGTGTGAGGPGRGDQRPPSGSTPGPIPSGRPVRLAAGDRPVRPIVPAGRHVPASHGPVSQPRPAAGSRGEKPVAGPVHRPPAGGRPPGRPKSAPPSPPSPSRRNRPGR